MRVRHRLSLKLTHRGSGIDKALEQAAGPWLMRQPLRMPLYRQAEGVVWQLDGLHQSIRGTARDTQAMRYILHSLMVMAVHRNDRPAQNASQAGFRFERHIVYQNGTFAAREVMAY